MLADDLNKQVHTIQWWHRIDLGNGIITPGLDDSPAKLKRIGLPEDLSGMTVLDVGASDGFFSFEAERRGATRVLAIDSFSWGGENTKAGFLLARRALKSKVQDMELEVLDVSPEKTGVFDVVLFLGVLYHMRHPLLSLEHVFSVTKKLLILETAVDCSWSKRPQMAFYPGRELNNDPYNWWGPNAACVEAMCKTVGFQKVEVVWKGSPARGAARAVKHWVKNGTALLPGLQQNRMVFHAWR
jgi:tRNA (mo5U34)-methyltransferase